MQWLMLGWTARSSAGVQQAFEVPVSLKCVLQCHVVLHICLQNSRVMLPDFATSKRVKNATVYDVWMAVTETECTDLRDNPSKPSTVGGVRDCLYKILGEFKLIIFVCALYFLEVAKITACPTCMHFLLWCLSCNSALCMHPRYIAFLQGVFGLVFRHLLGRTLHS